MGRMWWIGLCFALCACSAPDDSIEQAEWDLTEDNAENDDDDDNNVSSNNVSSNNVSPNNVSPNNVSPNNVSANNVSPNNTMSCLPVVPAAHRPSSDGCDDARQPGNPPPPDGFAECQTDSDCPNGANGRCIGNNHDGWYCTYDGCFADADCGADAVCECDGGFRSDHNVCLPGNCTTNADCATGFCSPSQGDCGSYFGTIGYFCHTCEDECIDDTDCGDGSGDPFGSYCMYDPGVGHWRCSDSHCAG